MRVKSDDDSAIKGYTLFSNHSPDFEQFFILTTNDDCKVTMMESQMAKSLSLCDLLAERQSSRQKAKAFLVKKKKKPSTELNSYRKIIVTQNASHLLPDIIKSMERFNKKK